MIKGLPFVLAFTALPTFAAPQLLTEITAGDVWVKASYSQIDTQLEYTHPTTKIDVDNTSTSSNADLIGLVAFESDLTVKPLVGLALIHEHEKLQNARASFGLIGKTLSEKNIAAMITIDHSEYPNQSRGSYDFELNMQTTNTESKYYNQLGVLISIPKDEGEEKGGESIYFVNRFKLSPLEKIDVMLNAAIGFTKDEKYKNSDLTISSDPSLLMGGEIAFNITPEFSASFSIDKGFINQTNEDEFQSEVDLDFTTTIYEVSFTGRF